MVEEKEKGIQCKIGLMTTFSTIYPFSGAKVLMGAQLYHNTFSHPVFFFSS